MQVKYWKIDDEDIPDDVKTKAIESITEMMQESGDSFYSDMDGYFPDEIDRILGYPSPKYWDLDRGSYIQFDLGKSIIMNPNFNCIKDLEIFRKWLKIPKRTWDKIDLGFTFENIGDNNTVLEFETLYMEDLTKKDEDAMEKASEIFSDAIHDAFRLLQGNYEYEHFDEDHHIEMAISNEWCFDESGDFVNPD
jgi:hypothetical protein